MTTELFPKHMWDIFGMERLGDEEHGIPGDEGQRAHDLLMAEIAAVVSKGMRHVVAPPSAVWRHKEEEAAGGGDAGPRDTATPYAKHVSEQGPRISPAPLGEAV